MLHGVTVRSSLARGQSKTFRLKASAWEEFVVVTAKDILAQIMLRCFLTINRTSPTGHKSSENHRTARSQRQVSPRGSSNVKIEIEALPAIYSPRLVE
jgi:hypothetical protein